MKTTYKINCPNDLKKLSTEELYVLADEIRDLIIKKVNTTGGHLAPNLGFVEPTIALHRVFDSPEDKIVFDVSHQCYTHKIITGRKEGFLNPENYYKCSGYSNPNESEHDCFVIGHTSTSVSLATGLAKARDLKNEKYNVISIIGDGSLSGGMAFEGLNNAAVLNSNFIVIINDNEMSIAENQGGLYKNLELLRKTKGNADCNFFKSMGFDYYYVENGNNIEDLTEAFRKVQGISHPCIVHLHTLKGKGLEIAEKEKESFHWMLPHTLDNPPDFKSMYRETYDELTTNYILEEKLKGEPVVAITAGTPGAVMFTKQFRKDLGANYTDVAIAEAHAVAYAAGIAKNGGKPIFAVLSSFLQRTYDQLSQDFALNNSPATILVCWGGLSSADMTHLGSFDIPLISNIPNIIYLAPTSKEEYLKMLDWSVNQFEYPVAIRVPFGKYKSTGVKDETDYSILNKYKVTQHGEKIAIIALGSFYGLGEELKKEIFDNLNINSTLINPKFISGIDKDLLEELKTNHDLVITLEDGILSGGFGEKISRFYGNSDMKVLNYGGKKEFTDRMPIQEMYAKYHLTKELIVEDIKPLL